MILKNGQTNFKNLLFLSQRKMLKYFYHKQTKTDAADELNGFCMIETLNLVGLLIHFSLMFYSYTPWKCQKTKDFLKFPGGYRNETLG